MREQYGVLSIKFYQVKQMIKELRKRSGMTQKEFAEYFKIPKRTVENWEIEIRKCPEYLFNLMEYKLLIEGIITNTQSE